MIEALRKRLIAKKSDLRHPLDLTPNALGPTGRLAIGLQGPSVGNVMLRFRDAASDKAFAPLPVILQFLGVSHGH